MARAYTGIPPDFLAAADPSRISALRNAVTVVHERPTMSATERVLDSYPADRPAVLEILADDPLGAAPDGGDDDEGVPERQRVALLEVGCLEDVARRDGVHGPPAIAPDERARLRPRNHDPELAGEVHIQLLQDLGTEKPLSGAPQVGQDLSGDGRLLGFASVIRIEDDVRIDERPHRSYTAARAGEGPPPRS